MPGIRGSREQRGEQAALEVLDVDHSLERGSPILVGLDGAGVARQGSRSRHRARVYDGSDRVFLARDRGSAEPLTEDDRAASNPVGPGTRVRPSARRRAEYRRTVVCRRLMTGDARPGRVDRRAGQTRRVRIVGHRRCRSRGVSASRSRGRRERSRIRVWIAGTVSSDAGLVAPGAAGRAARSGARGPCPIALLRGQPHFFFAAGSFAAR